MNLSSNRYFILWLQSIQYINICREPLFLIKKFFVFILMVQATLSLMQRLFVDWVNYTVHTCDIRINKYIIIYCWLQVRSVVNFMSSKFWTLLEGVLKVVMRTGLNVYKENSGDSRFISNSLLVSYKWSQTRFTSCTNLIFFVTFIKLFPIQIQKNIYCWWIIIKENPKYKL